MNILGQKISLRRILGMIAGVVIIGIGIAVFKFSHLGNDSISALNLRLAELVGLPFSIENVLMNLFLFHTAADLGAAVHRAGHHHQQLLHRVYCDIHERRACPGVWHGGHTPCTAGLGGRGCAGGGVWVFAVPDGRFRCCAL